MKKCLIAIGVILFLLVGGCLLAEVIVPDDWEVTWEMEAYFCPEDIAELTPGTERSSGVECVFQRERYRKVKLRSEAALIGGTCSVRLLDKSGNVFKEWTNCSESFEEELDEEILNRLDVIEVAADDDTCAGSWKMQISGKMNLFSKIKWIFSK